MMGRLRQAILATMLVLMSLTGAAQFNPERVCRVADGRLIFTLDRRWTQAQKKEVQKLFSLDSAVMAAAYSLKPVITDKGLTWKVRKMDDNWVELSRDPGSVTAKGDPDGQLFLLDDDWIETPGKEEPTDEIYGLNRLTRNTVVQLDHGRVRFFLPGREKAGKVILSGSFNGWSTLKNPMIRTDSGWTATLMLKPGRYAYKFIIDGRWSADPYNKLREDDTYNGVNSIFFVYNHRFTLKGYSDAKKVIVSGSFNNWNREELRMIRYRGQWVLPLYLREGTYAYKFIVDAKWITDPANTVVRPDGRGNDNSFVGIGDTLFFRLDGFHGARKVIVCGDFNGWNQEELRMTKTREGWQMPYVLAPGNYKYKFIVDGKWITDPANAFYTGTGTHLNSWLAVEPNYWFRLDHHEDADHVYVTGNFSNWDRQGYKMEFRQGSWWFPVRLKPGKYIYKFIVDGKWILDPGNNLWEDNEYGTGNSVLWIEP